VSGTSNLLSWVTGAQNANKAASKKPAAASGTTTVTTTAVVPGGGGSVANAGSAEASDTTACGSSGVSVNASTTSCAFAENVESAYFAGNNSGGPAPVTASSPATGENYTMNCESDTDGNVTCTGGVSASLTFSG
jgi:serine/threonine-protein kinase